MTFILTIYFHAGVTPGGLGHSVISVFLPQDAVSKGIGIVCNKVNISKFTCGAMQWSQGSNICLN